MLNENGVGVGQFLSPDSTIGWTPVLVKEIIFRPSMMATTHKNKTNELTDEQAEKLFAVIADRIQQKYGLNIWEEMIEREI